MEPVCSSVYTAGWKTRPFQIVSTNMEREDFFFFFFFSGLRTLTLITDEQSKSSREKKNTHQNQTPVCSPLKSRFGLMRLLEVLSLHGLFLWHGKSGDYPIVKVIYLAVRPPLGLFFFLCGEKERRGPILRFMTYCVKRATPDKQVGALM